ncbi:hypothetical protein PU630_07650 [Microbacterium horticulturae]|uniref:Uncharacterized protein n=1 Tax=Microbacterium horticulturae TaxID=3028316 RepID=A0ABY8C5Q2_9MICO|nr:hypothetical protein [Microbacterium sp. KACC 23027]WEG10411.1 hypothetical protein PU630_07650 [Microbacterium sp. KACC 23027]
MHPDTAVSVRLDAICGRPDILHEPVGEWVGYFDGDWRHGMSVALLKAFPAAAKYVEIGHRRRGRVHGTTGF